MPRKNLDPFTIVLHKGQLRRMGPKGTGRTRLIDHPDHDELLEVDGSELTDEGTLQDEAAAFLAAHPDGDLPLRKGDHDGPDWLRAMTREELTAFVERAEMPFR